MHFELLKALVDQLDSDALSAELASALSPVLFWAISAASRSPADFLPSAENAGGVMYWYGVLFLFFLCQKYAH